MAVRRKQIKRRTQSVSGGTLKKLALQTGATCQGGQEAAENRAAGNGCSFDCRTGYCQFLTAPCGALQADCPKHGPRS